jgi:L-2,4-diaminobutyrate decarboxylase
MTPFAAEFLTAAPESHAALSHAVACALRALREAWPATGYSGKSPESLSELFQMDPLPIGALPIETVFAEAKHFIANSMIISDPEVAAHYHAPPLIASIAAEIILTALNQSMDSFDQAPAATMLELRIAQWLCEQAALPSTAAATFTTGGSQSNYLALLIARESCLDKRFRWPTRERGLPPEATRLRILCSEAAHFTVAKSATQLGLGTNSVIQIPVDSASRMSIPVLQSKLGELVQQSLIPMAIVATAGTTDFASIDPIREILPLARSSGAWLHVDGAYGGALLFSARHRHLLGGSERADSISVDFHKLLWQPISCAALLVSDSGNFRHIESHSDYLNPETDRNTPNLVTHSLMTTRRFDALKLWISLQILGRDKLAQMIDRTIELAQHAAKTIRSSQRLRLLHEPELGCLVFQYVPSRANADANQINAQIRDRLLYSGKGVIGRTKLHDQQFLKLTVMNPTAAPEQLDALIYRIEQTGFELESTTPRIGQGHE